MTSKNNAQNNPATTVPDGRGTHQGSVSLKHLQGYLEEFAFRFNRRHARRITHGAERLLGIAIVTPPRPFWNIVGRSRPQAKARLAALT